MFDWELALEILPLLAEAAVTTALITIGGFVLALAGGVVVLLLRRSPNRVVSKMTSYFAEFVRSTPLLVQLFFLYFLLPEYGIKLSALETGLLALSIHYSCYLAEVYRAGLESIPHGQWDSTVALNLSKFDTYRRVIIPQMIPQIIPSTGNYLVYMFKDSPLLAAISVQELMFNAQMIGTDNFQYFEPLTIAGLIFLFMSGVSAMAIRSFEAVIGRDWRVAK